MAPLSWKTETRKVSQLVPFEHNPRVLSKKQAEQLGKSLKKFNLVEIPAINTDGLILAGHQRIAILKAQGRGEDMIDVRVPSRPLTDAECKEYNLRSNKNTGEWNFDELANFEPLMLEEVGFDLTELGLAPDDAKDAEPQIDQAGELNEKWKVKAGDLFGIGEHRLLCGDATDESAVAQLLNGAKADMIFTDPPYNIDYTGKTKQRLKIQNDSMTDEEFSEFLVKAFGAMRNAVDSGAPYYVCHGDIKTVLFREALAASGFEVKQTIIWAKQSMVLGRQDYQWRHEPILYGWAAGASHKFYGGRSQTTVWEIDRPTKSESHPTMKPLALCAKAITNSSRTGDTVLDPFGGSGSTMVASENTNRKCRMVEISPAYCAVILQRMTDAFPGLEIKKI